MNQGLIISGFAGIGKTTLQQNYTNVIDLESSDFKWIYPNQDIQNMDKETRKAISTRVQNPLWPLNYVKEIVQKSQEYDIVLISQDKDMRDCLKEYGYSYMVCFPKKECKSDFIQRYIARGNNEKFISLISSNFESWIDALMDEDNKIIMAPGEFLEDTLDRYGILKKKSKVKNEPF